MQTPTKATIKIPGKRHKKNLLLFFILFAFTFYFNSFAQDSTGFDQEYATAENESIPKRTIFRSTQIINVQTTEIIPVKGTEFTIKHRFGQVQLNKTAITQFLGLDLPTNIRLGFAMAVSKKIYIGAGRTKYNKTYDIEGKFAVLRQSLDNSVPIALSVYFNTAIATDKFPNLPSNAFFSDSITPFHYKFSHRIAYNTQLIVARQFGEKLALQLAPVFIYKNIVSPEKDNYFIALPVSGTFQTGLSSSIIFEYTYFFNNQPENHIYPLSIGYEVGTAGHIFQIIISSSQQILEQELYSTESKDYTKGNFMLGFNIKRIFFKKRR